jgi:hypothetical protein
MARPRMNSPVRIKNGRGFNKNYNGEVGTIFDIKAEGRKTYYIVRLNGGHEISADASELEVLKNR